LGHRAARWLGQDFGIKSRSHRRYDSDAMVYSVYPHSVCEFSLGISLDADLSLPTHSYMGSIQSPVAVDTASAPNLPLGRKTVLEWSLGSGKIYSPRRGTLTYHSSAFGVNYCQSILILFSSVFFYFNLSSSLAN